MSLSQLLTHNGSQGLYAPYTASGGGGGGTVSTFSDLYASSLSVAHVYGAGGVNDPFTADGGINVGGIGLSMGDNPIQIGAGNPGIVWSANDGVMTGVSSINGSAYPPAATGGGCFQLGSVGNVNLTGGTGGGVTSCTATFTTVVGDYYRASICFVYTPVSGSPSGNAFLFFQTTSDAAQVVHIPLSSITPSIPFEMTLFFKGTVTSTAVQVGLNDSGASQCTLSISAVAAAPVAILEKLGAPQVLT